MLERSVRILSLVIACGCYSSGGQTKDGQSHWLERCSTQADCGDEQICACGVCTIACEGNDSCGQGASCQAVEDRVACEDAPSRATSVCLTACAGDAMCGDSELSCQSRACVAVVAADEPDAALSSGLNDPLNPCDDEGAREPLAARVGEVCYELPLHNGDGEEPFEVLQDEAITQTYYEVPWPAGSIATRFGLQQDDRTSLHRALLFEATGGAPGQLERNAIGTFLGQDARVIAGWATGGCNVELPSDMGIELAAPDSGKLLLVQWQHFNMTGETQRDASRFQICTAPRESRPNIGSVTVLGTEDLGGQEGMPAGEVSTYSGDCLNRTEEDVFIAMYWPHMHELGEFWRASIVLEDGSEVGSVAERAFEHDQNAYYHYGESDQRIALGPGQKLRTACRYFNSRSFNVMYGPSLVFEQCYSYVFAHPAGALDKPDNLSLIGATNTCWGD